LESLEVASELRKRALAVKGSARHSNKVFRQALREAKLRFEESKKKEKEFWSSVKTIAEAAVLAVQQAAQPVARDAGEEFEERIRSLLKPDENKDESGD
jgi:ribosome maturation protein Sdo1